MPFLGRLSPQNPPVPYEEDEKHGHQGVPTWIPILRFTLTRLYKLILPARPRIGVPPFQNVYEENLYGKIHGQNDRFFLVIRVLPYYVKKQVCYLKIASAYFCIDFQD